MNFQKLKKDSLIVNIILATCTALLLAKSWTWGGSISFFVALVPLLIIEKNNSRKAFFAYSSYTIILWHILSVFWITKASAIGLVAATGLNLVLWNVALQTYSYIRRRNKKSVAYVVLVTGLIAMEHLNIFNSEITWPWLVLGNGFANSYQLVQWYEYTGVLGGSLWVIITNILFFEFYNTRNKKPLIAGISLIIGGAAISLVMYYTHTPAQDGKVKVAVIQPNFDPYNAKFTMGKTAQLEIVDSMIQTLPQDVDYIVLPETVFDEQLTEEYIDRSISIKKLKKTLAKKYPTTDIIMGSITKILYYQEQRPTPTARTARGAKDFFYDISNSSLSVNPNRDTDLYKKSKLVIGVEMLPFNNIVSKLGDLSVKLGGTSGAMMPQEDVECFTHTELGVNIGVPICYEAVYGEYFSQFVKNGASAIFLITNDGWWDDTYGYKQLFSYSRLRAIETRREIARCANTGISGFINSRGDSQGTIGWWKSGILIGEVNLSTETTFYTERGDYIGYLSWYVFVITLLYSISLNYKKKLLSN